MSNSENKVNKVINAMVDLIMILFLFGVVISLLVLAMMNRRPLRKHPGLLLNQSEKKCIRLYFWKCSLLTSSLPF